MAYEFDWVAAFSDVPFGGNGAVVVHDCLDLKLETRLKIVRETSLVECTFVEPSDVADFKFRIYLARGEVPFAGHPTVAGIASLLKRGLVSGSNLIIETKAGLIPIKVGSKGEITMQQIAPVFGASIDPAQVAAVYGMVADDIVGTPQVVSTGLPFPIVVVKDRATIEGAVINQPLMDQMRNALNTAEMTVMEPFLVTLKDVPGGGDTFARLLIGEPFPIEDPFTGSATGAMASYLWRHGLISKPEFVAKQGHGVGRPGSAIVSRVGDASDIQGVRLTAEAHVTMSGTLNL